MEKLTIIDQTRPDQTRPDYPIVRNSSLELLRIVAILMIIAFHLAYKSGFNFSGGSIVVNRLWIQFLGMGESLGYVGNDIFVIISGYFLIKSSRINFTRLLNLWLRILFYSVLFFTLHVMFGQETFSFKDTARAFMPITTRQWWFMTSYFFLYILHPLLNDVIRNLNRENCRKFILLLLVSWGITLLTHPNIRFKHYLDFICMYSLGSYIRLWADKVGSKKYILLGAFAMAANFMCIVKFVPLNMSGIYPEDYFHAMTGALNIIASVCMFLGFKSLNIGNIRTVNVAASAVSGVYMLHDHAFAVNFWWHRVFKAAVFQDSPYLIPYMIFAVIIVYVSCTIIDLLRSRLFRALSRGHLS